jgi:hypothetical protein
MTKSYLRGNVQRLRDVLEEYRSDIAEILEEILDNPAERFTRKKLESRLESRTAEFKVPKPGVGKLHTLVQYDTLTTLLEVIDDDGKIGEPCESWYGNEEKPEDWS